MVLITIYQRNKGKIGKINIPTIVKRQSKNNFYSFCIFAGGWYCSHETRAPSLYTYTSSIYWQLELIYMAQKILSFLKYFPKEFNWRKKIAFSDWIIFSTFRKILIKIICMYRGRWSQFILEIWIDNLRQHSRNWGGRGVKSFVPHSS